MSCYDNCPRCFDLCYNQHVGKKDNAFAQWGSLIHKCMELFFKGELDLFSLEDYYHEHYDEFVTCEFPYNKYSDLASSYYEAGEEYLGNFPGLDTERYEVLGVEQEFKMPICGVMVRGFIDLILRDRNDGSIILVDHKSASSLTGKKLEQYLLQLYIYTHRTSLRSMAAIRRSWCSTFSALAKWLSGISDLTSLPERSNGSAQRPAEL